MVNDKAGSIEWLLLVVIAFSLTLQNIELLPLIEEPYAKFSLTLATFIMNIIIFIYYPYQSVKNQWINNDR